MFDIFSYGAQQAVKKGGGATAIFGSKPGVAEYLPTDLGTEADRAAKANTSNMDDIMAMLDKVLPGYSDMLKQGSKSTMALLRGEIPQDVQDLVRRNSAYQSLTGGYSGSPMSRALTARDFGKTSLDLMQLGGNSAQRWAGLSQASVAPWMVTGAGQAETTTRNNLYTQATQQEKYNVLAAPDPGAAGTFNLQTALGMTALSFGMGSAMGAMNRPSPPAASSSPAGSVGGVYGNASGNAGIGASGSANAVLPWGSYTAGGG